MTTPAVSVIVAAYNEQRHIGDCLRSLQAQTFKPMEVIVADDGSKDATAAVAARHGVRVLRLPHAGKARTVNAAAATAQGTVLFFLDADLTFAEDYVARLAAPILSGEVVGTSHSDEFVANPDNVWSRCLQHLWGRPIDRRLVIGPEEMQRGSVVFRAVRRDRFLAVGGFDDIGFLDDQTLQPKLGERARWISGAKCWHSNPDRLRDVWGSGTWSGKSEFVLHGAKAIVRSLPPFSVIRAATDAWRTGYTPVLVYRLVYECGVAWGIAQRALGLDQSGGK